MRLGFQSIAQVSSTYGHGDAHTIVENCGNTLILRCSASEGGGTARFASQLIGDREVKHTTVSKSRRTTELFGSVTHSEHLKVEPAVLPSQVEQLPDFAGYLKYASDPQWQRVRLDARQAWATASAECGRRPKPWSGSVSMSDRAQSMDDATMKFGLLMESAQVRIRNQRRSSSRSCAHTRKTLMQWCATRFGAR
jgi:hypothetical protein